MVNVGNKFGTDPKETLVKTLIDPTASIVITSSTTKQITIYNIATAEEMCRFCPGEITTALLLSNDFKKLISTSDKGVIYIWRVPAEVTEIILEAQAALRSAKEAAPVKEKPDLASVMSDISKATQLVADIAESEDQK